MSHFFGIAFVILLADLIFFIMKYPLLFTLLISLTIISAKLKAQDTIIVAPNKVILANIIEIGIDEIKYKPYNDPDAPVFVIDKAKVVKVITHSGTEYTFQDGFNDPSLYAKQRKNALKFGLFSVFTTSLQFSYEHSLKPGRSMEFTLGIIGIGSDPAGNDPGGAFIKAGYKFISTPDYYLKGMRYSHLLKGWYAKPEIIISVFSRDDTYFNYYDENSGRETKIAVAAVINLGKQWVFSDVFLIDLFVGTGFGFTNNSSEFDYFYGFMGAGNGFPIALTGGFKVGFLFN